MAKHRIVSTEFWDDSYIAQLDPSEKFLFLYLLTNGLTNICGVYEIGIRRMTFDTGFNQDTVQRILERFERDGRCIYRDGWLAMRNWIKHQSKSPDVQQGIQRQLQEVPKELAEYVSDSLRQSKTVSDCVRQSKTVSDCHTSYPILSNSIKSNLTEKDSQTACVDGPVERPVTQSRDERIQEKKKLLEEQAKALGVKTQRRKR